MDRCHHVDSVVHSMKILLLIAKCQSLSNKLDMLIYCTLQMHVQQATYANELHVNVQQYTGGY